jgi:Uma2 family endonuclease
MDARRPAFHDHDEANGDDLIVVRRNVRWEDYKRALEMRGDHSGPRISYADGCLEIMSPSREHEAIKSVIGRLVEVYCLERGVDFRTYGSWTLKKPRAKKAVEPDECFVFGRPTSRKPPARPDLAIEVVWTSGGISKLPIYRAMKVREVWIWRKGVITPRVLRDRDYREVAGSEVLPGIDLVQLASFIDRETTSAAMRAYRAALTKPRRTSRKP